jgi:hypothetical protein
LDFIKYWPYWDVFQIKVMELILLYILLYTNYMYKESVLKKWSSISALWKVGVMYKP